MDALSLLIGDHKRVRGLFARFDDAHDVDDDARMADIQARIFTELEVHTAIEEEIFYPWARGLSDEIGEVVDEGLQEHHVVKVLMSEISRLRPGDDSWVAKMTVLIENVTHHADEEEQELFPKVRSHSEVTVRDQLGGRLDARKRELGAPSLADTIDLTTDELRSLATEQGIPGRSAMNHDELAATVRPSS